MSLFDFGGLPLGANLLAFAAGAAVVWVAGTRLSRAVDVLAEREGWGRAFVGVLLLGGITSLPEIATTVTASLAGNAPLAVNNILGGVAMQVTILAVADVLIGRQAITTSGAAGAELLEGTLLVIVLAVVAAGIGIGSGGVLPFDPWAAAAFGVVLFGLYLIKEYEAEPRWHPVGFAGLPERDGAPDRTPSEARPTSSRPHLRALPKRRLVRTVVLSAVVILGAGIVVAQAGDALAVQTGLGASFVGALFVAVATSLPEVSTTLEAVRLGQHRMAFSNIFGTNLFDAGLLFIADLFYAGPPVLSEVGAFAQVGALLGLVLTAVYLAGIIERRDLTVFRMGWDSLLVLALYVGGVAVLYTLR